MPNRDQQTEAAEGADDALDAEHRARLAVVAALLLVPAAAIRGVVFLATGMPWQAVFAFGAAAIALATAALVRKTRASRLGGNLVSGVLFVALISLAYRRGGIGSPALTAVAFVPLFAALVSGYRWGLAWAAASVVAVVGFAVVGRLPDQMPVAGRATVETVGTSLLILAVAGLTAVHEAARSAATRARAQEAARRRALAEDRDRLSRDLERELATRLRAQDEARALRADRLAQIGQLAASVAHEANNPMAYVMTNLDYVRARLHEERAIDATDLGPLRDAVDEARDGALRVVRIVQDLKLYSRPADEEVGPVDVRVPLEAALRLGGPQLKHRARIERRLAPVPPVAASAARLEQVFLNLIMNAAHAMPEGHADAHHVIATVALRAPDEVLVSIEDSGSGIAPEHLSQVTEPFFTTKPAGAGTGLGLSLCRRVVEAYGGRLEIDSTLGSGTTVSVVLPAAREVQASSDAPPSSAPAASERLRARILVIDDEPLILRSLNLDFACAT